MRLTRIGIALVGSIAGAVACGIDAVGSQPLEDTNGTGTPPSSSSSSSSSSTSSSSSGGSEIDAGVEPADASIDADASVDALADVNQVGALLELTHAPSPATVNLTTEGPVDWAYWGANGSTSSIRKSGTNVISALGIYYVSSGATASGFGTTFSWTNSDTGGGSSDGYYYVTGGAGVYEAIRVPSGPAKRTLVVWVGGNQVRGKLVAKLVEGPTALEKSNVSYESQTGTFAAQYTLEYRSLVSGELDVRWETDQAYGANGLRFTAVAIR